MATNRELTRHFQCQSSVLLRFEQRRSVRRRSQVSTRPTKQLQIQCSPTEHHLLNRPIECGSLHLTTSSHFKLKLSGPAHQLFDKCGTSALCSPNDQLQERSRELKTVGVESNQLGTALLIWQRKFNRLVNPARARG